MSSSMDNPSTHDDSSLSERREIIRPLPNNLDDTYQHCRNIITQMPQHWMSGRLSIEALESSIHDLWWLLIETAKLLEPRNSDHDHLINMVLMARELGTFERFKDEAFDETEMAVLPNGQKYWSDLPYLVHDLQQCWMIESPRFSATEREGLAVFTAKLCAVGVGPVELSVCALWLFREALEVDRPLIDETTEESTTPSVDDLLPACLAWLRLNKYKLVTLTVERYNPALTTTGSGDIQTAIVPGDLAIKANKTWTGFRVSRWLFWRRRFKKLIRCRDELVRKLATACFIEMIGAGTTIGLYIPNENKYLDKCREAIRKNMEADEPVEDDVVIGMIDWAN